MKHSATAVLVLLVMTTGAAQDKTEPSRPKGPSAATEARPSRDTATETDRPTWVDPLRAATITKETPPAPPPKACF
jgi:hypothetical protein